MTQVVYSNIVPLNRFSLWIKLDVSFAKEPYKRNDTLQRRPKIMCCITNMTQVVYSDIVRRVKEKKENAQKENKHMNGSSADLQQRLVEVCV